MIAGLSQLGTATATFQKFDFSSLGLLGNGSASQGVYSKLAASIQGLTDKQLALVVSSNGVSAAQAKQILMTSGLAAEEADAKLVKIGLMAAESSRNAVTIQSALATAGLSGAQLEEASTALIAANAEGTLTMVKADAILTTAGLSGATKEAAIANMGFATSATTTKTAVTGLGLSLKSAGASFVKFLKSPIGLLSIAAAAIGGVVAITNALTTTSEEAMESFEKANSALTDNTNGITSLNSELATNKTRIEELSSLEMPTLADEIELTALREKNTLLAAQLVSLEAVKKNLEDVTNLAGLKAYEALNNTGFGNAYGVSGKKMSKWEQWFGISGEIDGAEALKVALQEYKATEAEMATIDDHKSRRYLKLQKDLVDYGTTISTVSQSYGAVLQTFEKGTPAYEEASSALAHVSFEMGDAAQKASTFQNIISDYSSSNEELVALAQSGEVTAEKFKELQGGGLGKFLFELGFTAQQAADYLNTLGSEAGSAAPPVDDLTASTEALKTSLTKLSDVQGVMESIKQEMEDFGAIGMDNINKLLKDFPELTDVVANYLAGVSSANDVYSALQNVYNSDLQASKAAIVEKLKDNVEFYKSLGKTYTTYTDDMGVNQKIDLGNSKTLAQAKLTVETALLNELSFAWSKYYDATSQTYTAYYTSLLNSVSSSYRGDNPALNQALEEAFAVQSALKGASEAYKNLANSADFNNISDSFTDASDKNKTDKWKEAFEREKAALDHQLAMSLISETQYTNILEQKYKKYFSNKKKYLDEYNQYEEEVYKRRISENIADFDKQKKALDHQKTTGAVSEKKYTDTLEALYKKYFSNKKLYLEQYTQYEEEVYSSRQSILESDKEKIEAIFDATKDMIKQEWEDSKSILESQKESLDDSVSAQVDALEEVRDREKEALSERKEAYDDAMDAQIDAVEKARDAQIDALNDRKDAMEDAIDDEIEALEKSRDADKEALEAKKDNLADYVDARKKALQEMRDQDTYNDELSDKQKSVSDIQFQLNSMAGDTSDAAIRRRMELQDELNKAQKEVSTYVADHDYDAQIAALDAAQKLEDESIDSQVKALEKKIDNQIAAFEASKELQTKQLEAQIDAVNSQMDAQIEGLKLAKDAQDKAMEAQERAIDAKIDGQIKALENMQKVEDAKIDAQIKVIDDKLENEGLIVNEAYTRMNGMNKKLYADLIEWNNKYGTGIQTDITDQWKSAYNAVRTYSDALSALGATTSITTRINPKGYASGTMSLPYTGVVEHSENGAELILNAARNGGNYAMLNKGSPIFTAEQTANLKSFMARPSEFIMKALGNNVSSKMTGTVKASVVTNNNPTAVTINNDFVINGTDPSGIADEIKKIMPKITDSAVDKINKTIFRNGGRLTANSMA